MLQLLIGKEIRGHVLSYRFLLTLALFFVLIVSSVQLIALNYDRQLANYSEAKRAQDEKLKEGTDFRRLMWGGTKVDRRPNALSVLAMGFSTNTCFPAFSAARVCGKCRKCGVGRTTASIDSSTRIASYDS